MKKRGEVFSRLFTVLVLAVCIAAPLLFMPKGAVTDPILTAAPSEQGEIPAQTVGRTLTREEKIALFALWLPKDDKLKQLEAVDESVIDSEALNECISAAERMRGDLSLDLGNSGYVSSGGQNCYVTSNGEGQLRILQVYSEWIYDWKNWFIAYMDIDTREVLYAYYSGQCLVDTEKYTSVIDVSLEGTARKFASSLGMTYNGLQFDDVGDWSVTALFTDGEEERVYGVYSYVYEDAGPSFLIDLKFSMLA